MINAYEALAVEPEKYHTNLDVKRRLFKCMFHHFGWDLYESASSRIMGSCENLRLLSFNISCIPARVFERIT